ncbi:MAG: DNA polymerase III subunit chi [Rhodobacterales bacterium]|nr:MAG: DNA polymerase III subunit chi [Rhodobacterales bacterium]PIE12387.1 MAG: DNA polymerase III subunit chi [Rhodobacterales bacterium]
MAAYFYHMTRAPLETTLPVLLGKARGAGWKVLVRPGLAERAGWLDDLLWRVPPEGFLPHALCGAPDAADEPVLIGQEAQNGAECLVSVDGAEITAAEAAAATRVMVLFDGNDPAAVERARDQWRALTGAGIAAQYWSQESGRWEMKAER